MEENFDALDVIARTRDKVKIDSKPTGDSLFILWGSLTAFFFLLEFVCWQVFRADWCEFLWAGIPVIGGPWMAFLLKKDHDRTHMRTKESKLVLDVWMFAGIVCCLGGFVLGFANLEKEVLLPLIGLLVGAGAFVTGEVLGYRPKIVGGLAGAGLGMVSFLLQGDIWIWQALALAMVAMVALVIPGILYKRSFCHGI